MSEPSDLAPLIREKRVIVLCGAGGVGKTTTSAALALAGAQLGRRVLVLTIDPAKRLAEALGIPPHATEPSPVPLDRLHEAGLSGTGTLDAWMLDPRVVFERLIRKLSAPDKAELILQSRLYKHMSELVAGMQEYTAAEALYELCAERRYDLIVLDTPPSRNALDFLDAPGRLARFLDEGIVQLFLPKEGGGLLRKAGRLVGTVFSRVFGATFVAEMQALMGAMSGMFSSLVTHSDGVRALLAGEDAAFLLVTSTEEESLREALYFREQIASRGLPFAGFVLNRSYARLEGLPHPHALAGAAGVSPELRATLRKLERFADREQTRARADVTMLQRLRELAGGRVAVAAPHLGDSVDDLSGLFRLAQGLRLA